MNNSMIDCTQAGLIFYTIFQAEFDSQYGAQYECALEKLLWEFLTRLDQLLPVPDLAQVSVFFRDA